MTIGSLPHALHGSAEIANANASPCSCARTPRLVLPWHIGLAALPCNAVSRIGRRPALPACAASVVLNRSSQPSLVPMTRRSLTRIPVGCEESNTVRRPGPGSGRSQCGLKWDSTHCDSLKPKCIGAPGRIASRDHGLGARFIEQATAGARGARASGRHGRGMWQPLHTPACSPRSLTPAMTEGKCPTSGPTCHTLPHGHQE